MEDQLSAGALVSDVEAEAIQALVQGLGLAVECSSRANGLSFLNDDDGILTYDASKMFRLLVNSFSSPYDCILIVFSLQSRYFKIELISQNKQLSMGN